MTEKKILVTAALPYVNNVPHLGNLIPILSADVYSRFLKLQNKNSIFVCGTDEHGTTSEIKAKEEGLTPRELTNKYFQIHKQIYQWFNFDIDCFGRTSDESNHEISQDIFKKLYNNKFIIEQPITQMWDEKENRFLSDRFIIGTCPHCDFKEARGDQCDKCGKLLEPNELINPKSAISGATPIEKESKHLYIDLGKIEHNKNLKEDLTQWIETNKSKWTNNAITTTQAWIKEGLLPRCITRDLNWGVKVPAKELKLEPEFENKVFYSWFDAPIGYISITSQATHINGTKTNIDWKDWWKNAKETNLIQFMGKDNIPFHTILFPAFCIGAKDNYTLMNEISVNEYINYEGGKFSKSRQIGVFGDDAQESGIPADVYRYYLMAMRPEKEDTDFDWKDLQIKVNKELIGNLGNLINRVLTFISKFSEGKLTVDSKESILTTEDLQEVKELVKGIKIKATLQKILAISSKGNEYFQKAEPWVTIKNNPEDAKLDLAVLARLVRDLAILIEPFTPETTKEIFKQLGRDSKPNFKSLREPIQNLQLNQKLIKPLFKKLEDDEIESFKSKYGGEKDTKEFPLNLKIAEITSVKSHPDAEKLLILQIDLGFEKRQIVAGLKQFYEPEELIGKRAVVVTNLEPAKLRGELSEGMLLAGVEKNENNSETVKIITAKYSKPGEQVFFEGNNKINQEQVKFDIFKKLKMNIKENKVFLNNPKNKAWLKTKKEVLSIKLNKGKVY